MRCRAKATSSRSRSNSNPVASINALILGVVRHLVLVEVGVGAQRPQIEIENAVGFRKQPRGLGRGLAPQVSRQRHQQENEQNNDDGRLGAPGHARYGLPPSSVEE